MYSPDFFLLFFFFLNHWPRCVKTLMWVFIDSFGSRRTSNAGVWDYELCPQCKETTCCHHPVFVESDYGRDFSHSPSSGCVSSVCECVAAKSCCYCLRLPPTRRSQSSDSRGRRQLHRHHCHHAFVIFIYTYIVVGKWTTGVQICTWQAEAWDTLEEWGLEGVSEVTVVCLNWMFAFFDVRCFNICIIGMWHV